MRHVTAAVLMLVLGRTALAEDAGPAAAGPAGQANQWVERDPGGGPPAISPGLVWSAPLKRFVSLGGTIAHDFQGERPYDVQSFDLAEGKWFNDLPAGAEKRGGPTGNVQQVGYKSPYFELADTEGLVRPSPRQMHLWHQFAYAPWDDSVYVLACGRTLRYEPAKRTWTDLKPPAGPMPMTTSSSTSLSWAALCADPVNKEIVLFGGCGLATPDGSPGTWVYSTEKNEWRKLELKVQPPPRALSPMAFDARAKKIVLFGGERLDRVYADTWTYDCATRTWKECKPAVGPSPRFGHGLVFLPKAGKVLLVGGKSYPSRGGLYNVLPFELWTYDADGDRWSLVSRTEEDAPPQNVNGTTLVASTEDDTVLLLGAGGKRYAPHRTFVCKADIGKPDAEAAAKFGVKPGAVVVRGGPYDPDWYTADVPPPDPAAAAAVLDKLPANQWVALECPKWPTNRQGGGWSTVSLDTDRDQILHIGGGHASYFGNDFAIYDIKTGRWSISWAPLFALEYNGGLSGPGPWAFNGAPWGNHNYHAYAYDPTIKRVVYIKHGTMFYDPAANRWQFDEYLPDVPFFPSKYTSLVCPTPTGSYVWAWLSAGSGSGVFKLVDGGRRWEELKTSGVKLPRAVCDGSSIVYDSKRDRLLLTGSTGKAEEPSGQVWAVDLKTGQVSELNPAGGEAIKVGRFAREAVYLPKLDLVLVGYNLEVAGKSVMPVYDCAANKWLAGELPGNEFISGKGKSGSSVDLGLVYDPKRDLVWGVLCNLRPGALNVIRVQREGLAPLK